MVGRLIVSVLVAVTVGAVSATRPQDSREPYDALTASQRALLPDDAARGRDEYNHAPAVFRLAFVTVTARLSSVVLWDPENGEVLGSALELIERVEAPDVQPAPEPGAVRLAVTLASGARDRLRRSREFARTDAAGGVAFVHGEPPQIRIELGDRPAHAVVTLMQP